MKFVSRAGEKLQSALVHWNVNVKGFVCADLGANVGGFTNCLLQNGAKKVFAVDTAYGVLDYKLRNDERVEVLERTNALHVELPEAVDLLTIDVGWTKQKKILPKALDLCKDGGVILSLLKPQYEVGKEVAFKKGKKALADPDGVLKGALEELEELGIIPDDVYECPVRGREGNVEYWLEINK